MNRIKKTKKIKFTPIDQEKQALNNLAVISEQDFIFESQIINPQINPFSYPNFKKESSEFSSNIFSQSFFKQIVKNNSKSNEEPSLKSNYKKHFSQALEKKKSLQSQFFNVFKNEQQYSSRSSNRFNKHCLGITNFMLFDSRCKSSQPKFHSSSKIQKQIIKSKMNHVKRIMYRKQKGQQIKSQNLLLNSPQKSSSKSSKTYSNSSEVKVIQKIDDKLKQKFAKLQYLSSTLKQKTKEAQRKDKKIYIQLQSPIKLSKVQIHQYYKKYVL